MARTQKRATEIATIDVALITLATGTEEAGVEYMLSTATKLEVAPQTETTDPIKLIIKRRLVAQKRGSTVVTGNTFTLTDNVFTPELVKILQGGEIVLDTDQKTIKSYTPPVIGSNESGEVFTLIAYSAQYDSAGNVVKYEKVSYPGCIGTPVNLNSEDDVFRVGEYTINSYPENGQAPYKIEYVDSLPSFPAPASMMSNEMPMSYQSLYESQNAGVNTNVLATTTGSKIVQNNAANEMALREGDTIQGSENKMELEEPEEIKGIMAPGIE